MAVSVCAKLAKEEKTNVCLLCKSFAVDEEKYGCMYKLDDVVVHHYCVLLSSQMEQNGQDEEGILGFLVPDIVREKKRASNSYCTYCQLPGATVYCCHGRCKIKFHVPCGVRNKCMNQFFGAFRSFCAKHRPQQKIPPHIIREASKSKPSCTICFEDVVAKPCPNTLWAPCCSKNAWFHRKCIQSLAISAGYFFKCPLCNDKESFQKSMLDFGIYVPQQDASWETTPNAFQELLERHDICDLPNCKCPKSRRFNAPGTIWELILCATCASQGIHIGCGQLKFTATEWECPECCKTIRKAKASKRMGIRSSEENSSDDSRDSRNARKEKESVKNKRRKRKMLKIKSKEFIDDSASSSSSNLDDASSTVRVPDENADIIVIDSDCDDLIEILDGPKFLPPANSVETAIDITDSSSDIDIVGDIQCIPTTSKSSEASSRLCEQPTAFIKLHNPSGSGPTVVSASLFRNSSMEGRSHVKSETPVRIAAPNPDLIITLSDGSIINQERPVLKNSTSSLNENATDPLAISSPTTSNGFIDYQLNTYATAPNQFSSSSSREHIGQSANNQSISKSVESSSESRDHRTIGIAIPIDDQQSNDSVTDPLADERKLLSRYHHYRLKPLRVIVKPLKFLQIGMNRFLTVVPRDDVKKNKAPKSRKSLRRKRMELKVESSFMKTCDLETFGLSPKIKKQGFTPMIKKQGLTPENKKQKSCDSPNPSLVTRGVGRPKKIKRLEKSSSMDKDKPASELASIKTDKSIANNSSNPSLSSPQTFTTNKIIDNTVTDEDLNSAKPLSNQEQKTLGELSISDVNLKSPNLSPVSGSASSVELRSSEAKACTKSGAQDQSRDFVHLKSETKSVGSAESVIQRKTDVDEYPIQSEQVTTTTTNSDTGYDSFFFRSYSPETAKRLRSRKSPLASELKDDASVPNEDGSKSAARSSTSRRILNFDKPLESSSSKISSSEELAPEEPLKKDNSKTKGKLVLFPLFGSPTDLHSRKSEKVVHQKLKCVTNVERKKIDFSNSGVTSKSVSPPIKPKSASSSEVNELGGFSKSSLRSHSSSLEQSSVEKCTPRKQGDKFKAIQEEENFKPSSSEPKPKDISDLSAVKSSGSSRKRKLDSSSHVCSKKAKLEKNPSSSKHFDSKESYPVLDFELHCGSIYSSQEKKNDGKVKSFKSYIQDRSSNQASNKAQDQKSSKSDKGFPRISLSSSKLSKSNDHLQKGFERTLETSKKVSPPINKFFPVLDKPKVLHSEGSNKKCSLKQSKNFSSSVPQSFDSKVSSNEKILSTKSAFRLKSSISKSKEMSKESKENVAMDGIESKDYEKNHQTKMTDFCFKNNVAAQTPSMKVCR